MPPEGKCKVVGGEFQVRPIIINFIYLLCGMKVIKLPQRQPDTFPTQGCGKVGARLGQGWGKVRAMSWAR